MLQPQVAARAVRLVALSLLDDAASAAVRLRDGSATEDEDALHDFRVAVRRLRSWLRAWKPRLSDSISRKSRRRLKEIASATGPARDAEVHLAWLRAHRSALRGRQRAGADWLIARLDAQLAASRDSAVSAARELLAMREKLSRRIHRYTLRLHPKSDADDESFAIAIAKLARRLGAELRRRLRAVHDYDDDLRAHQARIAAKRLRYLLEPIAEGHAERVSLVESLVSLQDTLGDLHDAHVFSKTIAAAAAADETEDRLPRLLAIERLLDRRGGEAFEAVRAAWLGDSSAPFFHDLDALVTKLKAASG